MKDERLDQRGKTYAEKRTLLWGKVDLFTAAVSWEIEERKESGKKRAPGKISPMYKANKQSKEHKNGARSGASKPAG